MKNTNKKGFNYNGKHYSFTLKKFIHSPAGTVVICTALAVVFGLCISYGIDHMTVYASIR
jgi:hypothetical protein